MPALVIPRPLQKAIKKGRLTEDQLRQLITKEAAALRMSFAQAVERGRAGTLPRNVIGLDLDMLVSMLPENSGAH